MPDTDILALPLLDAAQAQKHVTHNEALLALDALTQLAVASRTAPLPPAGATAGERRIVPSGGTPAGAIAVWRDGAWSFLTPLPGWIAHVADEGRLVVYGPAGWAPALSIDPAPRVGVNATADAANRLIVKSDGVLFSHDDVTPGDGSVRLKLNKAAPANVASLLFQTGWAGRAELASESGDGFALKVSADGAIWRHALAADLLGRVAIGKAAPAAPLDIACGSSTDGLQIAATATAMTVGCADSGSAPVVPFVDFNVKAPDLAAAGGVISFFRQSPSSGQTNLRIYRSNGAAAINTLLGGNSVTYLAVASGNVGVGTSAPHAKLTVNGLLAPLADNASTLGSASYRWSTVYAATGVINTSDARAKQDVRDCPLGLDFVRALRPRLYRWIEGGADVETMEIATPGDRDGEARIEHRRRPRPGRRAHLGLIAQEVKTALDAAGLDCGLWVAENPADPDSSQSLRYDQFVAPLIGAVQELARRLDRLERRGT